MSFVDFNFNCNLQGVFKSTLQILAGNSLSGKINLLHTNIYIF